MTALLAALLLVGPRPIPAKVSELLKDPEGFDRKSVAVRGKVEGLKSGKSGAGNDFTTFELVDGKQRLDVFLAAKLDSPPTEGDRVAVTGRFEKESRIAGLVVKPQIDASPKIDRVFGVKKLRP